MLKKLSVLAVLGLASASSLSAFLHPAGGQWGVQAEFLYLLPTVEDTFYVTEGSATILGSTATKRNNDFDFTPGFRVEGAYGLCDNSELVVRYARLRATQSDSVSGFIGPVRDRFQASAALGSASSNLDLLYQNVEALYDMGIWNSCKFNLDLQAGLEYAYVRLNEQYRYDFAAGFSTNNLYEKTQGIGPQIGLAFNWDVYDVSCGCMPGKLSFVSRTATSLLVSETEFNQQALVGPTPQPFNVQDDSTWRIVPAFHARFGFNYETCFSCLNASLEIGYEFHSYVRAISRELFNSGIPTISNSWSNYNNFDANGLYVALGVGF